MVHGFIKSSMGFCTNCYVLWFYDGFMVLWFYGCNKTVWGSVPAVVYGYEKAVWGFVPTAMLWFYQKQYGVLYQLLYMVIKSSMGFCTSYYVYMV